MVQGKPSGDLAAQAKMVMVTEHRSKHLSRLGDAHSFGYLATTIRTNTVLTVAPVLLDLNLAPLNYQNVHCPKVRSKRGYHWPKGELISFIYMPLR